MLKNILILYLFVFSFSLVIESPRHCDRVYPCPQIRSFMREQEVQQQATVQSFVDLIRHYQQALP